MTGTHGVRGLKEKCVAGPSWGRTSRRQVLTDAEAAGLVRLHNRGGHDVEILPALWAGHDKGLARGMCLHDMVYARAAQDWPKSA